MIYSVQTPCGDRDLWGSQPTNYRPILDRYGSRTTSLYGGRWLAYCTVLLERTNRAVQYVVDGLREGCCGLSFFLHPRPQTAEGKGRPSMWIAPGGC